MFRDFLLLDNVPVFQGLQLILKYFNGLFAQLLIYTFHQMSVFALRIRKKIPCFGFVTVPCLPGNVFSF